MTKLNIATTVNDSPSNLPENKEPEKKSKSTSKLQVAGLKQGDDEPEVDIPEIVETEEEYKNAYKERVIELTGQYI